MLQWALLLEKEDFIMEKAQGVFENDYLLPLPDT